MKKFKYSLAIVFFILTTSVYSQTEGGFSHLGNYDDGTEIYIKVEKDNSFSKDLFYISSNQRIN